MREKIIALIQKKIDVTKPERLAEEIYKGLAVEGYILPQSKMALPEANGELSDRLDDAEREVMVWNSRANRQN